MDENPFAKYQKKDDKPDAAGSENPFAKYATPSVAEDVKNTIAPSTLRGTLSLLTTPGSLEDLLQRGVAWGVHKVAPDSSVDQYLKWSRDIMTGPNGENLADKNSIFPTYDTAKSQVEKRTGPLYEAKTPIGKGVQAGLESFPTLLAGGEGVMPSILRSAGAGAGGQLAREGGDYVADYLKQKDAPEWAQKSVGPVSQAVGTVAGAALGPRMVTPLPMNAERASEIAALQAQHPKFPMSAGQMTDSPTIMGLEARSPRMADMPARQEQAFTQGSMERMGSQGPFNSENLKVGKQVGEDLGNARSVGSIDTPNFQNLVSQIKKEKRGVERVIGRGDAESINNLQGDVFQGAAKNPQGVMSMPGARYQYMRNRIQGDIDAAATNEEKMALSRIREGMDQAFYNSVGPDQAAKLQELERQYANYNILNNINPTAKIRQTETIQPSDVFSATAKKWGTPAVNEDRGNLVPYARSAEKVMTPFPESQEAAGPLSRLVGSGLGLLSGGAAGHATGGPLGAVSEGLLGSLAGHSYFPDVVDFSKNLAGRAVANPLAQRLLKNQVAAPAERDKTALLRLLMSPAGPQLPSN